MRPMPLLACSLLLASACGPITHRFHGRGLAIGADAVVELEHQQAGTHDLRLTVRHLPPPSRIAAGATTYAMWFRSGDGEPVLAGFLEHDPDDRRGVLRATTPDPRFELLVTAERDQTAAAPSEHVVLHQHIASGGHRQGEE